MKLLTDQIRDLRDQGILPIVTFQDHEFEDFDPVKLVKNDFWAAAEAGAVIVSGSQAHFPQGIDLVNGAFVHYGLGNLYFDQMATWLRKATIDFHYFYDGRYINSSIVPIINENSGQPRLMDSEEANRFLATIYQHSFYYPNE
jgi:poly-gamma-glutamate synthesis protein (capsule biosynthesis protein)